MSLWNNEDSERQQQTQRVLIIVGAAAAILIVFWVFRNAIAIVSRPSNGVGFASSGRARRLINGIESEGAGPIQYAPAPGPKSSAPQAPIARPSVPRSAAPARPAYIAPPPPPVIGGAYAPRTNIAPALPELSSEERAQAKAVTAPLRRTLSALQDYDRKSFWNSGEKAGSTEEAENAVDALGAMVSLYGHPDRFPIPMRGGVSVAAAGMRSYLRLTLDAAGDPAEQQRLRPSAVKCLTEANAAVSRLEGVNPRPGGFAPGISAN